MIPFKYGLDQNAPVCQSAPVMKQKNPAAVALGHLGGARNTPSQKAARIKSIRAVNKRKAKR